MVVSFKPSSYQKEILKWIGSDTNQNGICNAVAGSGKSTTLNLIAQELISLGYSPKDIKIIVFGKQNSLDLIAKFGEEWKDSISTLHGIGYQILKSVIDKPLKVINKKYSKIGRDLGYFDSGNKKGEPLAKGYIKSDAQFLKLFDYCRFNLGQFFPHNLKELSAYYGLDKIIDYEQCSRLMLELNEHGLAWAKNRGVIDFNDMVYLPVLTQFWLHSSFEPCKFVLVDECQDLNNIQLRISMGLTGLMRGENNADSPNGRLFYVGDPNQAIYGFAGANSDSYYQVKTITQAKELPLSICYRCPKSHIALVNQIFPDIPIFPCSDALNGSIEVIDSVVGNHENKDLVISRKTAPLIQYHLELIARGIPSKVKGSDIKKSLLTEIDNIYEFARSQLKMTNKEFTRDPRKFSDVITTYEKYRLNEYADRDMSYASIGRIQDLMTTIEIIYQNSEKPSKREHFKKIVKDLFSETNSFVTLCTVHRAKGLESDRVFILKPNDMPLLWKTQQVWEYKQELNILYVALTRSRRELFLMGNCDWFKAS